MTADFTYGTYAVYDPTTNSEVDNGTGGKFVLVFNGPAQPIFDLNGTPISEITSNSLGQSSQFRANTPNGLIQFGTTAVTVFCNETGAMAVAAYNAIAGITSISTLQAQVNTLQGQVASLVSGGSVSTTVSASGITDSTAVGRVVLTAADTAAGRTAIGAGTYTAPAVIAAGTTAALARSAIGFDTQVYTLRPLHFMQWNSTTATWWGYNPATNAMVDGQARPSLPQGMVWYDCQHDAAATYPTGSQAPIRTSTALPGDKILAHENSPFYT